MRPLSTVAVLLALWSSASAAQDSTPASRVSVRGVVWDSLAAAPLSGATVQLIGDDSARLTRSVRSNSLGHFAFGGVPPGRYTIGFLHPMVDSLGLDPPLRAVTVAAGPPVDVALAIPSPSRIRDAACGVRAAQRRGVVIGFVRDARDRSPIPGTPVRGEWLEYTIAAGPVTMRRPSAAATTSANGWFALCDLPGEGHLALFAGRSADSTSRIDVEIPANGFVRRDLYVDLANPGAPGVRISGTVIAAATGHPLRDAQVHIAGRGDTRTDEAGAWALADVPPGTRMLDVRALGFYPAHFAVDVVADAAPLRVELLTMRAMLDTIRVTATRTASYLREFEERRRRTGIGSYLTRDNIERLHVVETSQLFLSVPGMTVEKGVVTVRGAFDRCEPDLFIDGVYLGVLKSDDVNLLTDPDDIAGIEVYHEPHVPAQFSRGLHGGCGSVVIWRMPPFTARARNAEGRHLLKLVGVTGGVILIATVIRIAIR